MPNTEVITKWVEALESGEFKQGRSVLAKEVRGEVQYCCLGVLCELAAREGVVERINGTTFNGDSVVGFDEEILELPGRVRAWAGFDFSTPVVTVDEGVSIRKPTLVYLNDATDWNFEQIAGALRSNFLETVDA